MRIEGFTQLQRHLNALPDQMLGALEKALYVEGETVMTRSKQIVPVDLGVLRASGHVKRPVTKGTRVTVTLGYGGAASAYALAQHERTDYRHAGQGQAHYLSDPVAAAEHGFTDRLLRRVRSTLTKRVI